MRKQPTPVLYKTIFQVRYKPQLSFYNLLMSAAQRFSEYPHWETTGLRVVLRDFDKHCSLAIGHNAFGYEQDSSDVAMEEKYIQRTLEELPSALQIESFNRFGYRRQYLIAVDMSFESLVSVMNVKLLSHDERLRRIMPAQVKDLMYRVDSADDHYKYHFTVGPVRKQEIPRYVTYNREHHLKPETGEEEYQVIVAKYPEVAVFVDVDLYQEEDHLRVEDAAPFTDTARQKVHRLTNDLSGYLFAKEVEV